MGRLIPCRIRARAGISPSEDPQKVLEAMLNVMPGCTGEIRGQTAEVRSGDMSVLDAIREALVSRQTLGGLRRNMAGNVRDDTTKFLLNRQAAYAGVAAVCDTPEESPLGPIEVEVKSRRMDDIILWISGEDRAG